MVTIYIDDSGSSPSDKVVVASGIIIPSKNLTGFEQDWKKMLLSEGIPEFHTSECVARNHKSHFAGWNDVRVATAIRRARRITLKHSVKGFCIAIYKKDYDEVMPEDMRKSVGSYYMWSLSSLLGLAYDWAAQNKVPIEYILDTVTDKQEKRDIDEAMEITDQYYPGHFVGHYAFRDRKQTPALQAADLFAWTCFSMAKKARANQPCHPIAEENWFSYRKAKNGSWAKVQSLNRQGIEDWVRQTYMSPRDIQLKQQKAALGDARKINQKARKSKISRAVDPSK